MDLCMYAHIHLVESKCARVNHTGFLHAFLLFLSVHGLLSPCLPFTPCSPYWSAVPHWKGKENLCWLLRVLRRSGHRAYCCCSVAKPRPSHWDPMDCGPPGSSDHGVLQARILEWVAIPFSRGSSRPRDQTPVSCVAGSFFITQSPGKAKTKDGASSNLKP